MARRRPPRTRSASKRGAGRASRKPATASAGSIERRAIAAPAVAPAPARKPTYHEAVGLYERGLQALQRRDFAAAADALRSVIQQYPDERELLERARLYLKVCERELEPREPTPRTADEWVFAATVALNAGNEALAEQHLQRALGEDPRHDHAHYMMALACVRRQDSDAALEHLRQAIALNPENRSLARQDPDLEFLRDEPRFQQVLEASHAESAPRPPAPPRPRRSRR